MAVSEADLAVIDAVMVAGKPVAGVWSELRERLPHLFWTRCEASDVVEEPFRVYQAADLHLVDGGSGHCIQLTPDPAFATGLVLALRGDRS